MGQTRYTERRMTTTGTDAEFLTKAEVASLLRVSTRTVDRMRFAGELPAFRMRRSVRFRREDVVAVLEPE